jgi:hypothetical protein
MGSENLKAFVEDTAAKTGKGRSTIAREAKRGADIRDVAQLAGTSLDSGAELDAMARLPEAEQRKARDRGEGRQEGQRQAALQKAQARIHGESEAGREGHRAARVRWPASGRSAPTIIPRRSRSRRMRRLRRHGPRKKTMPQRR